MAAAQINSVTRQTIEDAYRAEEAREAFATSLSEIPISYNRVSPEWWTALLCTEVPGAKVVSSRPVAPDDLDRGHMRVFLEYNAEGQVAGLPSSVFCKDSQNLPIRIFNAQCDTIRGEIIFYDGICSLLGISAPEALYAAYDDFSHNSLVVMKDLDLAGAKFCVMTTSVSRDMIECQIAYLAKLHARFYGRMDQVPVVAGLRTFSAAAEGYDAVMDLAVSTRTGFVASGEIIPARLRARVDEVWPATQRALDFHRRNPIMLTHNDAHLRNWYQAANGDMCLADWQCVARGHWGHDVAFMMSTSLKVEDRRAWERDLIGLYCEELAENGGPRIDRDAAWDIYRLNLPIALSWWTPCVKHDLGFSFQPDDAIIEVVRRTATAIDDLEALDVRL